MNKPEPELTPNNPGSAKSILNRACRMHPDATSLYLQV